MERRVSARSGGGRQRPAHRLAIARQFILQARFDQRLVTTDDFGRVVQLPWNGHSVEIIHVNAA